MFLVSPLVSLLILVSIAEASVTPIVVVQTEGQSQIDLDAAEATRVPVILGIRSTHQSALLCQSVFDQVLKRVPNRVNLSFAYVAELDAGNDDFGVSCGDGYFECAADVQQSCVSKYSNQNQWWQYVMCQQYHGKDSIGSIDVARRCANAAYIDWDSSGVGNCVGTSEIVGTEGKSLLQQNVKASQAAGIDTSCTVIINDAQKCIHDGVWRECEEGHTANDFVRQINTEWGKLNNFVGESFDLADNKV